MSAPPVSFADVSQRGRRVRLEYRWLGTDDAHAPLLVFLHEGLGSIALWRDYPARLCAAAGCRGLVWSRAGYGRSTPRPPDERWSPDFLEIQAVEVLPALLAAVGVDVRTDPPWLFGHSDGGSIALLHAARFPDAVAGLVVLAPHLFVEDLSVRSITAAREAYVHGDLRAKLARYHEDVDSAFWGWNDIWLDPRFRDWNIEGDLAAIRAPLLAVQGEADEYGTMAQIDAIRTQVPQAELLKLPDCGHSPHREQPQRLDPAVLDFIARHAAR